MFFFLALQVWTAKPALLASAQGKIFNIIPKRSRSIGHLPQHTVLLDQHENHADTLRHFPDRAFLWEQPMEGYPKSCHKHIIKISWHSRRNGMLQLQFPEWESHMFTRYSSSIFSLNAFAVFLSRILRHTILHICGSLILNCKPVALSTTKKPKYNKET